MTTNQMIKLLGEKNILIIDNGDRIYHDNRTNLQFPLESHYALIEEDLSWNFCFVMLERRSIPEIEIDKFFDTKDEAIIYFFLNRLGEFFLMEYIFPAREPFREMIWDIDEILRTMRKNNIPEKYFSYTGSVKPNSVFYYEKHGRWYREYLGKNCEVVAITNKRGIGPEEKDGFLRLSLNDISLLYYLDEYVKEKIKEGKLDRDFTDVEKARYAYFNI